MSDDRGREPDRGRLSQRLTRWLSSLVPRQAEEPRAAPPIATLASIPAAEILRRAAACYNRAGWEEDACRLYEQVGDERHAAAFHERLGRHERAARGYERVGEWRDAARCYLLCERPDEAAECQLKAGDVIEAAWTLAHLAHRFGRAEALAAQFSANSESDHLAVNLILARCDAGAQRSSEAAQRLHASVQPLRGLSDVRRFPLFQWTFAIADVLRRPDLSAILHAAAVSAGLPQAGERWEEWALNTLGDAAGVPAKLGSLADRDNLPVERT